MVFIPLALFVSAALALWLATLIQRRPAGPAISSAVWMLVGVGIWCTTSAFHGLVDSLELKIFCSKIQYAGMVSVPPLWFLFAAEYSGAPWSTDRRLRLLILGFAVATFGLAVTNEWHRLIWSAISLRPDGSAVYEHGGWFWLAVAVHYAEMLVGAAVFFRTLRRSPEAFRGQLALVIAACLIPWLFNVIYLLRLIVAPGFDLTPLGFAVSCVLLTWAVYRNQLFDLVPVARDMLIDSLSDAVIVVDPARRILDLNASGRLLAARQVGWLGAPLEIYFPFLAAVNLERAARQSHTLVSTRTQLQYEVRVMELRSRSHHHAASVLLLRDVTSQRKAAAEREVLEQRVREQQKRESLSVLAGGLAHDFNNLLAGIIGNADLLALKSSPASETGKEVGAIILGAQRAADLVSKMLAYAGERHGSTERVDLDQLIRELLDLLRASAGRHCTLTYEGTSAPIIADATQIRQVAMNLIINAAEAVEEGSGVVAISTGVERLSAWQLAEMKFGTETTPGEYAFLQVRDNGVGMDEATLQRVFNPFFTTKQTGHGLGLSAVQGIVRSHRGALRVDSKPGAGSRFVVWFPLADREASGPRPQASGLVQAEGQSDEASDQAMQFSLVRA